MIIERIRPSQPQLTSHREVEKALASQVHTETTEAVVFDEERKNSDQRREQNEKQSPEPETREDNSNLDFPGAQKIASTLVEMIKSGHSVEVEA